MMAFAEGWWRGGLAGQHHPPVLAEGLWRVGLAGQHHPPVLAEGLWRLGLAEHHHPPVQSVATLTESCSFQLISLVFVPMGSS